MAGACTIDSLRQRPDGALLVSFMHGNEGVIAGYDAEGQPLAGFGGIGSRLVLGNVALGFYPSRVTMAQTPGGDIYVAASNNSVVKIGRLTAAGALDPAFGTAGLVTVSSINMMDVAIDPAGKIVIVGSANGDGSIVRLTASGEMDSSFSGDGRLTIAGGTTETFMAPVFLSGNRLAVNMYDGFSSISVFTDAGEPDVSFDGDGTLTLAAYSPRLTTYGDDLMTVGGTSQIFSTGFVTRRVSAATGAPAPSFGTDGVYTLDWSPTAATGSAFVFDDLGRMVLGGWRQDGDFDATLIRIWL
jgi:uncharacterized delta-60 repeat protein